MSTTIFQRSAFPPGVYRGHKFGADRLKMFADATNRAISAGIPIPLLKLHAPINASDTETEQFASNEGAGWIKRVGVGEDGALEWEAEGVPEDMSKLIQGGTVKFTSPEFRDHYVSEKAGVYEGPIIRHFAFTPKPGNPHQGAIESAVALEESVAGVYRFNEDDYEPITQHGEPDLEENGEDNVHYLVKPSKHHAALTKKGYRFSGMGQGNWTAHYEHPSGKTARIEFDHSNDIHGTIHHGNKPYQRKPGGQYSEREQGADRMPADSQHAEFQQDKKLPEHMDDPAETSFPPDIIEAESPPVATENPDMPPPAATDKTKLAAVLAGLNRKGVVLPSDFDFATTEGALDILLAALNSSLKAETDAEAEAVKTANPEDPPVNETSMPFEEEQFAEANFASVLKKHGYSEKIASKKQPSEGFDTSEGGKVHAHADGHVIEIHQPHKGSPMWMHWAEQGIGHNEPGMGHGSRSLNAYLNKFHSTQHGEAEDENSVSGLLRKHGYKHVGKTSDGGSHYVKGDGSKSLHQLFHYPEKDDEWHYDHSSGNAPSGMGKGAGPLGNHLSRVHDELGFTEQFSEAELAALPEKARKIIIAESTARKAAQEEARKSAVAFEEERNSNALKTAKDTISKLVIPPALRVKLLGAYDTVQFSEGNEAPTFTAVQVAQMVAAAIPPALQFSAEETSEATLPKGVNAEQFFEEGAIQPGTTVHVSPERARELVRGNPMFRNHHTQQAVPIAAISDMVTAENHRVPNQVMRK